MKTFWTSLTALVLVVLTTFAAQAKSVTFKPGALKAAVANGETVLLHYKSTW